MPLRVSSIQTISKAYDLYKTMHQVQLLCSSQSVTVATKVLDMDNACHREIF